MPLTIAQRENRALLNLQRNDALTRRQLWCASVSNAALERLAADGRVVQMCSETDGFALTPAGEREIDARFARGEYSTIQAKEQT